MIRPLDELLLGGWLRRIGNQNPAGRILLPLRNLCWAKRLVRRNFGHWRARVVPPDLRLWGILRGKHLDLVCGHPKVIGLQENIQREDGTSGNAVQN
jgi:hypothetical protein